MIRRAALTKVSARFRHRVGADAKFATALSQIVAARLH
jgi:hypothetical protein